MGECEELLRSLDPELRDGWWVFCEVPDGTGANLIREAIGSFREDEGVTLIVPREVADVAGLPYSSTFSMITLRVQSSLDAVGLTAAVSTALAEVGIAANVVAAFHHDHLFVPSERADEALRVLRLLQERAKSSGD